MATVKEYAYYIKGTKLAIIEKDTAFDNDPNSRDYGPGADYAHWKSPITSITDGIEIEYVHSPTYKIVDNNSTCTIESYIGYIGNKLKFNLETSETFTKDDYILVRGSSKWSGLHKVSATTTAAYVLTETVYNGSVSVVSLDTATIYDNINVLNDEADEIDLPSYLSKALVYYVKARLAEDTMNLEGKEYFMKQFRTMVEKYDSTRMAGPRKMFTGSHAIR